MNPSLGDASAGAADVSFARAFPGFAPLQVKVDGVEFRGVVGGSGPPVLLLHGYPQTHLAWRHVAPSLAAAFTVVVPDLPGYGDSRVGDRRVGDSWLEDSQTVPGQVAGDRVKDSQLADHSPPSGDPLRWTKRRVAAGLVQLMEALGYTNFSVVGHDRGARAGYRMALDHPQRVRRYVSLAVVPTLDAWDGAGRAFGLANFHWFFLAQAGGLPERLLAADPDAFIDAALAGMAGGLHNVDADALAAYRAAFRKPSVRHAICEDYRAAATEDLDHDRADRAAGNTLACPVMVLWPGNQAGDVSPLAVWHRWANDVCGHAIAGGHLLAEASPQAVLDAVLPFLADKSATP